jgi:hypothetical protein
MLIATVFAILIIGVLVLLARRALRLIVRLALVGVLVLFLLIGGLAWWWYGAGDSSPRQGGNRPASTRRTTSR